MLKHIHMTHELSQQFDDLWEIGRMFFILPETETEERLSQYRTRTESDRKLCGPHLAIFLLAEIQMALNSPEI